MSGGRNSEASAVAALALAIHRSPARYTELLRGDTPLPASVSVLLRLAGGTAASDLDPALASLAPESELRQSALFFIEQVLFQRDANHYRVLGLNPGAAQEQIKENHRLLMRLFHPDRETQPDERREQFATRANLAYNTLRDAGSRADYDTTLKPQSVHSTHSAQAPRAPHRVPAAGWRRMPEPESFWTVRIYPLLMRYLPQWVLAGTALVSLSIVGAVYLSNPPVHLQQASTPTAGDFPGQAAYDKAAPEPRVDVAAGNTTGLDDVVAQFERRIAAAGQVFSAGRAPRDGAADARGHTQMQGEEPAHSRPASVRPQQGNAQPTSEQTPLPRPVQQPAAVEAAAAPIRASAVVVQPAVPASPPPVVAQAAAAAPAPVAEPPAQPLPDPNSLLSRFLAAYERGDMQACMSLLDEELRADTGGKSELRREYDALFRSTDLRHIDILSMNWSRDGEFIRGEGRYRATVMRKGETLLRTQDGLVRVEMVRRGGTALISELRYLAGSRS
jgi:curved DNA-binding protein CbpA